MLPEGLYILTSPSRGTPPGANPPLAPAPSSWIVPYPTVVPNSLNYRADSPRPRPLLAAVEVRCHVCICVDRDRLCGEGRCIRGGFPIPRCALSLDGSTRSDRGSISQFEGYTPAGEGRRVSQQGSVVFCPEGLTPITKCKLRRRGVLHVIYATI